MWNLKKLPRTCWSKKSLPCVVEITNKQVASKVQNGLCKPRMSLEPNLSQRMVLGQQISQHYTVFFPNLLSSFVLEGHLSWLWGTLAAAFAISGEEPRGALEQTKAISTRELTGP